MQSFSRRVQSRIVLGVCALILVGVASVRAASWRIEAETAGDGCERGRLPWAVKALADASAGAALTASAADAIGESHGIRLDIPDAGAYWLWVRYRRATRPGTFFLLVRDEDGEEVAFAKLDWHARLATQKPYAAPAPAPEPGWTWEAVPAVFERALTGQVSFGGVIHGGGHASRVVDCVVVTDDGLFDAAACDLAALETAAPEPGETRAPERGMTLSLGLPAHTSYFAGVQDGAHRFHLGLINNSSMYLDYARSVRLGFNADHGIGAGSEEYGVTTLGSVHTFVKGDAALAKEYPAPAGRFVNAEGKAGRNWSLSFPPLPAAAERALIENIETHRDDADVEMWSICPETGGYLDYSAPSVAAFRKWLQARYVTIQALNEVWATDFAGFDVVEPPKDVVANKAGWFDFREFCGELFVRAVAAQVPVIAAHDPHKRPCLGQNSNLDLLAPYFTAMRPMDWEQYIRIALAGQPFVGWDTYCADDYMGCEVDLLDSLAEGRSLINQEWNVHTTDWRIAARTYWTQVSKGVKGISCFQFQEGTHHDSYPKWALLNNDRTPKAKLGAFADCAHEVHRLERLLAPAVRVRAVKPVALYYSRIDLSVGEPLASTWGEAVDSPYHVYEMLRGQGYPVRWITPLQISEGKLAEVAAVVMVNVQHVPTLAAKTLAEWVHAGGTVIGDTWPGAFDEHGRPQDVFVPVFGVRAAAAGKKKADKLALEESIQGYGEITIAALAPDARHKTVGEMWQQWDSTHPVSRELGAYMLSGFGLQRVECVAGDVIGMTFGGRPGVVVNQYGAGHAMHVAMLLGSLYSSSATGFEWDSTHSGLDVIRLLDAFLRFAGVMPSAQAELPPRLQAKLRVESPLVDPRGNAVVGLTSFNDQPLGAFPLTVRWPENMPAPIMAFYAPGGSRRLLPCGMASDADGVHVRVPFLDSHGTLLFLRDCDPLVAVEFSGAPRGGAGLQQTTPATRLQATVTVFNPSARSLPKGTLDLGLPRGWAADAFSRGLRGIKPYASRSASFDIAPPSVCSAKRLRPIVVRYQAGEHTSTPATELVWWQAGER